MIAVVLITHGQFGQELLRTAQDIVGRQEAIASLSVTPDMGLDSVSDVLEETIRRLAQAVEGGHLSFSGVADPAGWIERFRALPGVGEWTAQYVAMRALGEPDAFPAADLGLLRASGAAGEHGVAGGAPARI